MVVFHFFGERGDIAAVVYVAEDWRGRNDYDTLFGGTWDLQGVIYSKLDISVRAYPVVS